MRSPGGRTKWEEDREHRPSVGLPPVATGSRARGTQPQRGFTTKPGVAVTTAHPRRTPTKPHDPQRGSTSTSASFSCEHRLLWNPVWGSVKSPFSYLGCAARRRPQAMLFNPYRVESQDSSRWILQGRYLNSLTPRQEMWVKMSVSPRLNLLCF